MRTPEDNGPDKRQHGGADESDATSYTPAIPAGCSSESWGRIGAIVRAGIWEVPERNADGESIGWNRRLANGDKKQNAGGKRGLTMAWPLDEYAGTSPDDPVIVVEGASDCAAGLTLGLTTIGRPGAHVGGELLASVLKGRHVVIVGENDSGAGRTGAQKIGLLLADSAASVRMIFPPPGVKDLRAWAIAGATRDTVLDEARNAELIEPGKPFQFGDDDTSIGPVLRNAADIPVEEVLWLWPGRIPGGMLSIIAGDPGLGKSTLTTAIAAIVSTGGAWPGGGTCEAGGVLWLSAEDDPSRVIVPRLIAHGADLSRIELLDGVRRVPGAAVAHPSLADDLPALEQAIARVPQCRLIIIDPISAYLGRTDANANAEVRALLTPLKSIAEQTGAAVVLVQHLNKSASANALHRMTGSIGFIGAARTGYIVVRDPDDEQRRLFLSAKSNIGPEANGLGFRIAGEPPQIVFDDAPVVLTANDALAAASPGASADGALSEAVEFLGDFLAGGPRSWKDLKAAATDAGVSVATLRRAKSRLGVESKKEAFSGGWVWSLAHPKVLKEPEGAQPQSVSTFDDAAHLRPDLPSGW